MGGDVKKVLSFLGATAAGFTGVVALYPSTASVGSLSASPASSPTTTVTNSANAPTTTTSAGSANAPTTTTTIASVSGAANASAVGTQENYGYGTMSVKVTIAQHRIVGLAVQSLQTLESYSQQLEQYAVPILQAEVLKAQGIQISAVSGATYTSEAYAYSIQSALNKLHFK